MLKNFKIEPVAPELLNAYKNDSIIDVTNENCTIIAGSRLTKYSSRVPYWSKQYIRTYWEIKNASTEQQNFYTFFKSEFLRGEYFDLEGNNNYAFILLFDFLNEYDRHKDFQKLEDRMHCLGTRYTKTVLYCQSHLNKKREARKESEQVLRLKPKEKPGYQNYPSYYDLRLGTKLKTKLNLSEVEVRLLNLVPYPTSRFCKIEFCCLEVSKLYLLSLYAMRDKYIEEGTTLEEQFSDFAKVVAKEHFQFQAGGVDYTQFIEKTSNEILAYVFKHCENTVRWVYGHKQKINTQSYYLGKAKVEYETKIVPQITGVLASLVSAIPAPDEAAEIKLNLQNVNRWKIKFEELKSAYTNDAKQFAAGIVAVANQNERNASIKNIFFEATNFICTHDKEAALALYVHYLDHDLNSTTFPTKQLKKTIKNSLFKTHEQFQNFQAIVKELTKDKDLAKALACVSKIYTVKRKKIELNTAIIREVQQHHSGAVKLLNDYLRDECEDENTGIKAGRESEVDENAIVLKTDEFQKSIYRPELAFTLVQVTALKIFSESNFLVPQHNLQAFAKSKGIFFNPLISSINESCYEILGDVLIEEEGAHYTINPIYYQKLLTNDRQH